MKLKSLLNLSFFVVLGLLKAQNANIPNGVFKDYLLSSGIVDKNGDKVISIAEAAAVEKIQLTKPFYRNGNGPNIDDITGIDQFTNLKEFELIAHSVSIADLSKNTKLTKLGISYSGTAPLDLSNNINLQNLSLQTNSQHIDLSKLTQLNYLYMYSSKLIEIDLTQNKSLTYLQCSNNNIKSINLTQNKSLTSVTLDNTKLDSLDVSANNLLTNLTCTNSLIQKLKLNNSQLVSLDCSNNQLVDLDLTVCNNLKNLNCNNNYLSNLDISTNHNLTGLSCKNNLLTSLDLSDNSQINSLYCSNNQINSLVLNQSQNFYAFECDHNQITSLDLSKMTNLNRLSCNHNELTMLLLPINNTISTFDCSFNKLSKLDLSPLKKLYDDVLCNDNELTEIIFPNTFFDNFNCSNNKLTTLNMKNIFQLQELDCRNNQLDSLNLSHLFDLRALNCTNNSNLTTICIANRFYQYFGNYVKDSTAEWSLCKPETPVIQCTEHITPTGLCEDFYDADPTSTNYVNEYAFETSQTRWDNGPVQGEHAYMGMFWTEANNKNGFTAIKNRKGNGILEYTITQKDTVYEPFMVVFGSYADDNIERKLTVDLSLDKTISFDLKNNGDSVISVYVQLEDINGNNLMFDESGYQLGSSSLQPGPYLLSWNNSDFTCPKGKSSFYYDLSYAYCGKTEIAYDDFFRKDKLMNVLHPEIVFDYSQVTMVKFFISGYKNHNWKCDLVNHKIEISNFKLGNADLINTAVLDNSTISENTIYTVYDLLGNYITKGKESEVKLKSNQVYILKTNNGFKKKIIVE